MANQNINVTAAAVGVYITGVSGFLLKSRTLLTLVNNVVWF